MTATTSAFDARAIERPDPQLWTYYVITSFLTVFAWPIMLPVLYFRYHTLRYRFDDEGISMSVGFLFKREVHLTYRRIQDIHVTRGLIQRWLGLATISIQTASGSSSAEMQIEGVLQADELRDWLYARMRGASPAAGAARVTHAASGTRTSADPGAPVGAGVPIGTGMASSGAYGGAGTDDATAILEEILNEVRTLRTRMESRS